MKKEQEANYDPRMISAKKTPEKSRYPIHYLVWHNKHRQLEKELGTNEQVRQKRKKKKKREIILAFKNRPIFII